MPPPLLPSAAERTMLPARVEGWHGLGQGVAEQGGAGAGRGRAAGQRRAGPAVQGVGSALRKGAAVQ